MDGEKSVDPGELYTTARETLRSLAALISESGTQPAGPSAPSTSTQNQNEIYSSILVLKNAHRLLCENLEAVRQRTQGVKATLDATSLRLENLRYQERHYQREIRACRDFTEDMENSLMGDGIELVSEEDYRRYIDEELEKDRLLQAKGTDDAEVVMRDSRGDEEDEEVEEDGEDGEDGEEASGVPGTSSNSAEGGDCGARRKQKSAEQRAAPDHGEVTSDTTKVPTPTR